MRIEQVIWANEDSMPADGSVERNAHLDEAHLVVVFAGREALLREDRIRTIRQLWPGAQTVGCSTAGEIAGTQVLDGSIVATAIQFHGANVRTVSQSVTATNGGAMQVGERIAGQLSQPDLRHVFVLSDGLGVNGSELVCGLTTALEDGVTVTGGLAGDGSRFEKTVLLHGDVCESGRVVAVGFYGSGLRVGCGSMGGWDPFGPERRITRSKGNVLFELDGRPALDLYVEYLGEHAADLPAAGLLFPLAIRPSRNDAAVVRTILAVDSRERSLTFAGDMREGFYARLMRANFDRLLDGATGAARTSLQGFESRPPELTLLVSCVGRKLVLQQRIEEEVESVRGVLGETAITGFYSYGELAPFTASSKCELHNQTMTVTALAEA